FRSARVGFSGVAAEGVCAWASGDAVTKSAAAPAATIFNIGVLLGKLPVPRSPKNRNTRSLLNCVDLNHVNLPRDVRRRQDRNGVTGCGATGRSIIGGREIWLDFSPT